MEFPVCLASRCGSAIRPRPSGYSTRQKFIDRNERCISAFTLLWSSEIFIVRPDFVRRGFRHLGPACRLEQEQCKKNHRPFLAQLASWDHRLGGSPNLLYKP